MGNTDYFGVKAEILNTKKLFLLDMDGTIYKEEELFSGTIETLTEIDKLGGTYIFITNNSSKSVSDYIEKMKKMGIYVDKDNFFTSTQATAKYLHKNYPRKMVYCQGTQSFLEELQKEGIMATDKVSDDAEVILVGFDTEITGQKIRNTCRMLQKEIPYYATNPDVVCPVEFGYIPDCGSICMMYENATGRKPVYIGKPKAIMIETVMQKYGYSCKDVVVVGDRLYTDIAAGVNAGVSTICVLTGEATVEDIIEGDIKPSFTFESIADIGKILANGELYKERECCN